MQISFARVCADPDSELHESVEFYRMNSINQLSENKRTDGPTLLTEKKKKMKKKGPAGPWAYLAH